ncbi:hypothetical protein [Aquihabitans sp. G128]|uniref:hypothetical protein n=1 Tax=Aquihabitans sp. G128 TaxID=2849779 RepID=UPI00352EDEB7
MANPPIDTSRQGKFRADVARVTQLLAYELEGLIRLAPEQWHLLQPNWPSDRVAAGLEAAPGEAADEPTAAADGGPS